MQSFQRIPAITAYIFVVPQLYKLYFSNSSKFRCAEYVTEVGSEQTFSKSFRGTIDFVTGAKCYAMIIIIF